jgi:hypothetical protein
VSLLTNLVAYWQLDEASGNATDSVGSNTLTNNGSVGSATGKVGTARDFGTGVSTKFFRLADNADLSTGDIDFTFAAWVKPSALTKSYAAVLTKGDGSSLEYQLIYRLSQSAFDWAVKDSANNVRATNFGAPSVGTWYHLVCWHDSVNNLIGISVNAGTPNTTSYSGGVTDTAYTFAIGTLGSYADSSSTWDGLIDEVGFWKRVLTSQERTDLYNGGSGLAFSSFGGGVTPSALSSAGASTGAFSGSSLARAAMAATGSSSTSLVGGSLGVAVLASSGSSTAALAGSSLAGSSLAATGSASSSLVGGSLMAGVMSASGSSSSALSGSSLASSVLAAAGSSTASFAGGSVATGTATLASAGSSSVAMAGSSLARSAIGAAGSSSSALASSSLASSSLSAAGASTVAFAGASLASGTGTLAAAAASAVAFAGSSRAVAVLAVAGSSAASFAGGSGTAGSAMAAAGSSSAAFSGRSTALASLSAAGHSAVSFATPEADPLSAFPDPTLTHFVIY